MIHSRQSVLAAFTRALTLDPQQDRQAAMESTAQALGLLVEAVADVVEETEVTS